METESLPTVNWPTEPGEYRVVQLDLDSRSYLRFVNITFESHSEVLRKFLSMAGIEYESVMSKRSSWDVPSPEGPRYKVHGMGIAYVDVDQRKAKFYGDSYDYGLTPDWERLQRIAEQEPEWTFLF